MACFLKPVHLSAITESISSLSKIVLLVVARVVRRKKGFHENYRDAYHDHTSGDPSSQCCCRVPPPPPLSGLHQSHNNRLVMRSFSHDNGVQRHGCTQYSMVRRDAPFKGKISGKSGPGRALNRCGTNACMAPPCISPYLDNHITRSPSSNRSLTTMAHSMMKCEFVQQLIGGALACPGPHVPPPHVASDPSMHRQRVGPSNGGRVIVICLPKRCVSLSK